MTPLAVTTKSAGAEIYVDEEYAGTAPLPGPMMVRAGRVRLRLRVANESYLYQLDVAAGERKTTAIEVDPGHIPRVVSRLPTQCGARANAMSSAKGELSASDE